MTIFTDDGHRIWCFGATELLPQPAAMPVCILLCTYNGARNLQVQLDSLLTQTLTDWRLVWRDDGSTDETADILRAFAASQPAGRVTEAANSGQHLGVTSGFLSLLEHARPNEAVAFCDQDDRWLDGKLARAVRILGRVPATLPGVYASRQTYADADLTPLGESPALKREVGLSGALMENFITGCSSLLNPAAVAALRHARPPRRSLHDWWAFILVLAMGGTILFDEAATMLYRQHGTNVIGALPSPLVRLRRAMAEGPKTLGQQLIAHLDALIANQAMILPDNLRIATQIRQDYAGGLLSRLRLLTVPGLRRQGGLASVVNYAFLVFGQRGER